MVMTGDEEEAETEDEAESTSDNEDNEDYADFVEKEIDHEITFRFYCKRLGCFSHTLQLVMLKFSEHSYEKSTCFSRKSQQVVKSDGSIN